MNKNINDPLHNDEIIGTISKIQIKAKHVTFLTHGLITSRIAIVILNENLPTTILASSNIIALSFFNISNDGSQTMKYLQGYEPHLTTKELLQKNSIFYIVFSFEKGWILALIKTKESEVLIFNVLSMKLDFVISIIDSLLIDEFGIKADKFFFYRTMIKGDLEFVDNMLTFYLLKYIIENFVALDFENLKIPSSNFKSFKLKTLSKLDPQNNEKTDYMNSQNDLPEFIEFYKNDYMSKFETKFLPYKPKAFKDPNLSTPFEYKPQKNTEIRINPDDTLEFIRDEDTFSLDNSLEFVKDLEKLNNLNDNPPPPINPPLNKIVNSPVKTSSIISIKNRKPMKRIKSFNEVMPEEKTDIENFINVVAEEIVEEKKKKLAEDSQTLTLSKKELRQLILRHGVGVQHSFEKEKREKEEAEELRKQEQLKNYSNATRMNKVLWYYYLYFPEQYPLILAQYQQKLNNKIGLDFMIPSPPTYPLGFNQDLPKPETFFSQQKNFKLPTINTNYKPDFNQSALIRMKRNDENYREDTSDGKTRGRIYTNRRDSDRSLPAIQNRSTINKTKNNEDMDSMEDLRRERGVSTNKSKKNLYPNSATLRRQDSMKSISNIKLPNKNSTKVAERYGIIITKEDMRNLSLKSIVSVNLMDFITSYYQEKSNYLGIKKQMKFFKTNDFNERLLVEARETMVPYKKMPIILFFPVLVSFSKLLFGLLLLYPEVKRAVYYDPANGNSSEFMKNVLDQIDFKGEIENISGSKNGLFVLRLGYLILKGRRDFNIQEKHLEEFKGRIPQLIYEIGVTNNDKGELGDFNFII